MFQLFNRLGRTDQTPRTATHRVTFLADGVAATFRACRWIDIGSSVLGSLAKVHIRDLGDHVPRTVDLHPVADADILAVADTGPLTVEPFDIILVMERRIRDNDAPHGHRLQPRHRRQRAGAADLNGDILQPGPG